MSYEEDDDFVLSDDEEEMSPGTLEKEDSSANMTRSSSNLVKKKSSSDDDSKLTRQKSSNAAPPGSIESVISQVSNPSSSPVKRSLSKSSSMKQDSPSPSSKVLKKKQSGSASSPSNINPIAKKQNSSNEITKKNSFQRSHSSKNDVLSPIKSSEEVITANKKDGGENDSTVEDDEYDLDGSFEDDESQAPLEKEASTNPAMKRSVSFEDNPGPTSTENTTTTTTTTPASSSASPILKKSMSRSNSRGGDAMQKSNVQHKSSRSIPVGGHSQGSQKNVHQADPQSQPRVKKTTSSNKLQKSASKPLERLPSNASNRQSERQTQEQIVKGRTQENDNGKTMSTRSKSSAGGVNVASRDPAAETKPVNQSHASKSGGDNDNNMMNSDENDNYDDYDDDNGFEDEESNVEETDQETAKGQSQDIANSVIVTPQKSRPPKELNDSGDGSDSVTTKRSRKKKPTKEEVEYSNKISELDKKIREIAAEREKFSPTKMPKKKLPKVNKKKEKTHKTKAPKKFNHSKLKYIMADVTISPYMTSPNLEYSKDTLRLPEIIRHMKYEEGPNKPLPMDEKQMKDKFIGAYNFRKKDIVL
mmetsp:Transcript_2536/g.4601  ORF Transcript_2536/g.4601 Transcript_2536/m.4601 type:complete len:588 (+) Transcript_2536:110-1873(+)